MWGCRPSSTVDANTSMVRDLISTFEHRFNPQTLMLNIPEAFEHLKGSDANFEMVTSNTIQSTRMEYNQNIITESRAVIFINTSCNKTKNLSKEDQNTVLIQTLSNKIRRNDPDVQHLISENRASQFPKQTRKIIEKLSEKQRLDYLNEIFRIPWNNAYERGQGMSEFFTQTMHFDEANVKKCINYSKNQIIQELDRLRALAYNFDRNLKEGQAQENLAICVVWVGPSINSEVKLHRKLLSEL